MNKSNDKPNPHVSATVRSGDEFFINFTNFCDSTLQQTFSSAVHQHRQIVKDKEVTYRVLSHWDTEGLIECERNNDKGWRKFSFVESLWLFIVKELRQYGFGIDTIKNTKKCFFQKNTKKIYPLIEYYLALAIKFGSPIYLIIFSNGHAECFNYYQYQTALKFNFLETHLVIELNKLLSKLNIKDFKGAEFPFEMSVSLEQYQAFGIIKNTDFKSAKICKKGKNIDRVEIETNKGHKTRVVDLLNQSDNVDIVIKKRDGKIIGVTTNTLKKV